MFQARLSAWRHRANTPFHLILGATREIEMFRFAITNTTAVVIWKIKPVNEVHAD
jgi:hypothetical protein